MVVSIGIQCGELGLLGPGDAAASKDIDRTRVRTPIVVQVRADDRSVTGECDGATKPVAESSVHCGHVLLQCPGGAVAGEDEGRSSFCVISESADNEGVARYRGRATETVVKVGRRGHQLGLLGPGGAAADIHVRGTRVDPLPAGADDRGVPRNSDRRSKKGACRAIQRNQFCILGGRQRRLRPTDDATDDQRPCHQPARQTTLPCTDTHHVSFRFKC